MQFLQKTAHCVFCEKPLFFLCKTDSARLFSNSVRDLIRRLNVTDCTGLLPPCCLVAALTVATNGFGQGAGALRSSGSWVGFSEQRCGGSGKGCAQGARGGASAVPPRKLALNAAEEARNCATPLPPDWGKERRRRRMERIKNGAIYLTNFLLQT